MNIKASVMKIGLISDTHSTAAPLREALSLFASHKVDKIICAGDIAGYGEENLDETIDLLTTNHCLMVAGNHDHISDNLSYGGDIDQLSSFFKSLPDKLELEYAGKRIYVVHAEPPDSQHGGIKLLDQQGNVIAQQKARWEKTLSGFDYDVLVVGHTHQIFAETIAGALVINPGSTLFNHSCMILTLPEMKVDIFPLSGTTPVLSWNWGQYYQQNN